MIEIFEEAFVLEVHWCIFGQLVRYWRFEDLELLNCIKCL